MSEPLIFIGILLTLGCAISAVYFMKAYYIKNFKISVMLKGLSGVFFVLFGFFKIIFAEEISWPIALISVALLFGLVGDELLAMRYTNNEKYTFYFVVGAIFFGGEHILLVASAFLESVPNIMVLIIILVIAVSLSLVYLRARKTDAGSIHKSVIFYVCLLSLMCSVMISRAIFDTTLSNVLFALGGLGFIISDNVLLVYNFGEKHEWWLSELVHIAYYSAQLMFGWALFAM